jgi:hypothetical protein
VTREEDIESGDLPEGDVGGVDMMSGDERGKSEGIELPKDVCRRGEAPQAEEAARASSPCRGEGCVAEAGRVRADDAVSKGVVG